VYKIILLSVIRQIALSKFLRHAPLSSFRLLIKPMLLMLPVNPTWEKRTDAAVFFIRKLGSTSNINSKNATRYLLKFLTTSFLSQNIKTKATIGKNNVYAE
jgi:hypothetical protein